jgi:hypothetical protein
LRHLTAYALFDSQRHHHSESRALPLVNSVAYSLSSSAAGNGTTATGDATYTTIPDNAGVALFNNNAAAGYRWRTGSTPSDTAEANTTYKEGTGYPPLANFSIDDSITQDRRHVYRRTLQRRPLLTPGIPAMVDTGNNANTSTSTIPTARAPLRAAPGHPRARESQRPHHARRRLQSRGAEASGCSARDAS